ncbi:MAG TPA: thiamine-phosphate synthase family protein [Nitrososphaerales archaeon]|nr:thiamine-phosphate synthase family protein [Nitrososphaerales archaeon]
MQPPEEMLNSAFLPAMRHLVAMRLRSRGLSQNKISSLMGVTQASVSLYLSSDPRRAYGSLSRFSIARARADRDSDLLAGELMLGPVHGIGTIERIWIGLLGSGAACSMHREMYPSLADCDFCIREYGAKRGSVAEAVSEVAEAARLLEGSPEFMKVMPEVSVNIACATPGASTPADVVAIPGRIVKVRGRARAMLPPEAGASAHMSRVLLLAMRRRPQLRACINVRYDSRMARALKRSGIRTMVVGDYPRGGDDPTSDALERRLASYRDGFDAIADEGGAGIEPNLYLFARGAREAVELALRLAKLYSAG